MRRTRTPLTLTVGCFMAQMQLLKIPLDPQDVVYTPDWVAADMVSFFKPSGLILDPCKGNGVFGKYLPPHEWCEITEGKDFYAWNLQVDWVFGNPPYKQMLKWVRHSMEVSKNICYLIPLDKPFISMAFINMMESWGKIKHMRAYGTGTKLGFPIGFAVGALHFEKGYFGPMYSSVQEAHPTSREPRRGGFSPATGIIHPEAEPTAPALSAPAPRGLR